VKGIVFNLVEEVVSEQFGSDTWDDLLDAAGLDGAYTSLGSYPDEDLQRIVAAASSALEVPPNDVIRMIGQQAIPKLATRYPQFFQQPSCRDFLLTLNDIIHPEVRKLYPGADAPDFTFDASTPGVLLIGYDSARRLCALAEGFILGAGDHFGEVVTVEQTACFHRGDAACVLRCEFAEAR
jgi:hypothetical protein